MFICHGNICRSPTAEFLFNDKAKKRALKMRADSCAISDDTIIGTQGSPVFSVCARILAENGIDCKEKRSQKLKKEDYGRYSLFVIMDDENKREALKIFGGEGGDPEGKIKYLADYSALNNGTAGNVINDPWYTRDFKKAYEEIDRGVEGLISELSGRAV